MQIENLADHQPHMIITLPNGAHVLPVSDIRDCKHGRYMGDNALMCQLLAVALLDVLDEV